MIQELVEFGKRITKGKNKALKEESFNTTLVIDKDGSFQRFIVGEKQIIETEVLTAKKGKARFLLDKCEEVLNITVEIAKLEDFKLTFEPYKDTSEFSPIFKFYDTQNTNGLRKAICAFMELDEEVKQGNITFEVNGSLILSGKEVQNLIKSHIKDIASSKSKNKKKSILKNVTYNLVIVINESGEFKEFSVREEQTVQTEAILLKKAESYLLIGKSEEVLGITDKNVSKKHVLFIDKLFQYKDDLPIIEPIFKFYEDKNKNGLTKAISESVFKFDKDSKDGNITFMLLGDSLFLKKEEVREAITKHFQDNERRLTTKRVCSICGNANSPVLDEPHGLVKLPKGQSAGCALVSFNEPAFESYGLKGNLNSFICRDCARNYIEGLKFLLSDGYQVNSEGKKLRYEYNHRIKISDSTVALFWTRHDAEDINPFAIVNPPDSSWVKSFLESVWSGNNSKASTIDTNIFYCCTISSAAARIAVRDWTAISLDDYKTNIAKWFQDIEIINSNNEKVYNSLGLLILSSQRDKRKGEKTKGDLNSTSTIGTMLWNAAIKGNSYKIPIDLLQFVLNRLWKGDSFNSNRAAIIKLIINRNNQNNMKSSLDEANTSVAYLCGRLFAIIETMQWKAMGNVNSSIKDKFFAAAAAQPAHVFGTLLTKNVPIYQHKINGYLAKELNDIAGKISETGRIPNRFTTIEQGEFALGYYFQKNHKKAE